jgi:F-type H+-transporting ATPase subunit alpha
MRELTLGLHADFARYNEVVTLSRMQSGLSKEAQMIVDRGESITSIFVQQQYAPVPMADQVLLLFGLREGVLNKMSYVQRQTFNKEFPLFVRERFSGLYESLHAATELTSELEQQLKAALTMHMEQLGHSHAEAGSSA